VLDGPGNTDRDDRHTATSPERVAPAAPLSPGAEPAAIPASRIAAAENERDEALAEAAEAIEAAAAAEARLCEAEDDLGALRRRVEALEARHREETLALAETFEAELAEVRAAAAEALEAERAARMHAEAAAAQLRAELAALADAHAAQLGRMRAEAEARLDAALADQAERVVAEVTEAHHHRIVEAEARTHAAEALAADRARQLESLGVKVAGADRRPAPDRVLGAVLVPIPR
jgi:methyl-accepting chemotaxis protein